MSNENYKTFYVEAVKCPYVRKVAEQCPFISKQVAACPFLSKELHEHKEDNVKEHVEYKEDSDKKSDTSNEDSCSSNEDQLPPLTTMVNESGFMVPNVADFYTHGRCQRKH